MVADGILRTGLLGHVDDGGADGNAGLAGRPQVVEIIRNLVELLGADDQVDIGQLVEQGGAAVLGHAAQNPQHEARVMPPPRGHLAGLADGLLLGEIAHAAGVEQQDVAVVLPADDAVAPRPQHGCDRLAVAFVHLAAVGFDVRPCSCSVAPIPPRPHAAGTGDGWIFGQVPCKRSGLSTRLRPRVKRETSPFPAPGSQFDCIVRWTFRATSSYLGLISFSLRGETSPRHAEPPAPLPRPDRLRTPFFPPLCATLLEWRRRDLYRENPFRKTGLKVLAGARDLAKRIDQLKLSAELGTGIGSLVFRAGEGADCR